MVDDALVRPFELTVFESRHHERPTPSIVAADVAIETHDQIEEALEEEHAVRANRIWLQPQLLDAVLGPARLVVFAPQMRRDQRALPHLRIDLAARIGTDLCEPIDRSPIRRVALHELVEDARVDLAPS